MITKAMILAAGTGTRMLPLTRDLPKPLLKINGKCLIEYHLEKISSAGIKDVVINVSYLGEKIIEMLKDGDQYGLNIRYSHEPQPLETAGAIKHARNLIGESSILLVNADVYTDMRYKSLIQTQLNENCWGKLILVKNPDHNPKGDYALETDGCLQLPSSKIDKTFTFSGVSVLDPLQVYDFSAEGASFPLRDVFVESIQKRKLTGEVFAGQWSDVGTPDRLAELENTLGKTTHA